MMWIVVAVLVFALLVVLYFTMRDMSLRMKRAEARAERCVTVEEIRVWLETDRSMEDIHAEMAALRKEAEEKQNADRAKSLERAKEDEKKAEDKVKQLMGKDGFGDDDEE